MAHSRQPQYPYSPPYPYPQRPKKLGPSGGLVACLLAIGGFVGCMGFCGEAMDNAGSHDGIEAASSEPAVAPGEGIAPPTGLGGGAAAAPSPAPASMSRWQYRHHTDEMSGGDVYLAAIESTNTVNFEFPYAGTQHATLLLRDHRRHGKDILFSIEQGQLMCSLSCRVLVRFDDHKPRRYRAVGPNDGSTTTLFLSPYGRFYRQLVKADRVRISVQAYQEGTHVFSFDLSHFDPKKFHP